MNKSEVTAKVAEISGVDQETCTKVIDALEKVLQNELGTSAGVGNALGKIAAVLSMFKGDAKK